MGRGFQPQSTGVRQGGQRPRYSQAQRVDGLPVNMNGHGRWTFSFTLTAPALHTSTRQSIEQQGRFDQRVDMKTWYFLPDTK